jgi:CheY-like chemotaxis protein
MGSMKDILIIENDVFFGDALVRKLRNAGYSPSLVRDGGKALSEMRATQPDLVFLDASLPYKDGFQVLEEKNQDRSISLIPVVGIVNTTDIAVINRFLSSGAKDFIIKDQFNPEEIITKTAQQLVSSKTVDEIRHDKASVADRGLAAKSADAGLPAHFPGLSGKKIMWVEDDVFLSEIVARKLATQNCSLIHADNGSKALELAQKNMPDIIMLDILLPGMDGFEILRRLKLSPELQHIPVILLSNLSQQMDIDKGKSLGAELFLVKAVVSLDDILREIARVLDKSTAN